MNTKIRSDARGLFFRAGGYLFRPQEGKHAYPILKATKGSSIFSLGDKVKVRHRGGTPFGVVQSGDVVEYWHSHGTSIHDDGRGLIKDTAGIWNPK